MSTIPEATLPFKMSLAAFRKSEPHDDLAQLAKEHMKHDLEPSDRDALIKATTRVTTSVTVGTLVGLGLGVYTAIRLRQVRANMFSAFRTKEKPQFVVFANGRQEPVPDLTPLMRPTRFGDFATYFLTTLGGIMLGGELGLLFGTWSASRTINEDPMRKARVENAYRLFRADVLRKEASRLEGGGSALSGTI